MTTEIMTTAVEHTDEGVVVRVVGEVDMYTALGFARALDQGAAELASPQPLAVDLRGVTFFGSAGVAALMAAQARFEQAHIPIRLTASPVVARVLAVTNLDSLFALAG